MSTIIPAEKPMPAAMARSLRLTLSASATPSTVVTNERADRPRTATAICAFIAESAQTTRGYRVATWRVPS